jgi:adenine-specific DNA-methyltransferase
VSYSTDGNMPLEGLLGAMASRGGLRVFTAPYKRYRVSTPRMSRKSHNVEFVVVLDQQARSSRARVDRIMSQILAQEQMATNSA